MLSKFHVLPQNIKLIPYFCNGYKGNINHLISMQFFNQFSVILGNEGMKWIKQDKNIIISPKS